MTCFAKKITHHECGPWHEYSAHIRRICLGIGNYEHHQLQVIALFGTNHILPAGLIEIAGRGIIYFRYYPLIFGKIADTCKMLLYSTL